MEISQRIVDYAIRYYLRYYPSPNKLRLKLKIKFGPESEKGNKYGGINLEEIEYIIDEKLKNIIQENEVIKSKIRVLKDKGKSKLYVKQKLFERQENRELIDIYLEEAFLDGELELVKKEYEKLKSSPQPSTPGHPSLKQSLIHLDPEGEGVEIDFKERQRIIEKLMRKGFRYDDIKNVLIN